MSKFTVRELVDGKCTFEGYCIDVDSLADARLHAERNRVFRNTVLVVEEGDDISVDAANNVLCTKSYGSWINTTLGNLLEVTA